MTCCTVTLEASGRSNYGVHSRTLCDISILIEEWARTVGAYKSQLDLMPLRSSAKLLHLGTCSVRCIRLIRLDCADDYGSLSKSGSLMVPWLTLLESICCDGCGYGSWEAHAIHL